MASTVAPACPRLGLQGTAHAPAAVRLLGLLATVGSLAFSPCAADARHDPECSRWRAAFLSMPVRTVVIGTAAAAGVQVSVRVAATDEARHAGFQ